MDSLAHRVSKANPSVYAMSAKMLTQLSELLQIYSPNYVMEIGSGNSTIIIADYCQRNSKSFVTFDTERKYLQQTSNLLYQFGLKIYSSNVKMISVKYINSRHIFKLDIGNNYNEIDFLLIDGPSTITHGRRGVMKSVWKSLVNGANILVDDFQNGSIQKDVRFWKKRFKIQQVDTFEFGKRKMILLKKEDEC